MLAASADMVRSCIKRHYRNDPEVFVYLSFGAARALGDGYAFAAELRLSGELCGLPSSVGIFSGLKGATR